MNFLLHNQAALTQLAPLFALSLTIGTWLLGVQFQRKLNSPFANPVLFAIVVIGIVLRVTGVTYAAYFSAAQLLHFLLGPATVALAIPLVRSLEHIRRSAVPLAAALTAGSLTSALSGYALVRVLGGSQVLALSMLPKSVTTPIAIEVSQTIGGLPSLTAVLAIAAGILVAVCIDAGMRLLRIADWRTIGLAAGTAGSGIGASRVIPQHSVAAAFAGVALGANGLITSLLAPMLAALLRP